MGWIKMKFVHAALFAVGLVGVDAGWLTFQAMAADPNAAFSGSVAARQAAAEGPEKGATMKSDLEKLQGAWSVSTLEIDGRKMAENIFAGSKIVLNGRKFTTISMGATYKGTFKIDAASTPKTLDLNFTEGPEKGNTSLGIYELDGATWKICLTVSSKVRPKEFATRAGSGHALETLKRDKNEKSTNPLDKARGKDPVAESRNDPAPASTPDERDGRGHKPPDKEMARLEGEWSMVSGEINGQALPKEFLKTSKRVVKSHETTVIIGGQVFLKATFTVNASKKPMTIDYVLTGGPMKDKTQLGIYEWDGDQVRFCFSAPGKDRPTEFTAKAGSERTCSLWKRAKP